jgi:hypothetical protein
VQTVVLTAVPRGLLMVVLRRVRRTAVQTVVPVKDLQMAEP